MSRPTETCCPFCSDTVDVEDGGVRLDACEPCLEVLGLIPADIS